MAASSESSSEAKEKKRNKKKKKKQREEKHKGRAGVKKAKKRKVASSSSSSSSSSSHSRRKKRKAGKSADAKEQAKEAWILKREKAIRKAEPNLPKGEALKRAVEEYCMIYDIGVDDDAAKRKRLPSAVEAAFNAACPSPAEAPIHNEKVRDAVAEAVREATTQARASGKSEEEVQQEGAKAREAVLQVAENLGLYQAQGEVRDHMSLFLKEKEKELEEYVRLGVPSTDDRPRSAAGVSHSQLDVTRLRLLPKM